MYDTLRIKDLGSFKNFVGFNHISIYANDLFFINATNLFKIILIQFNFATFITNLNYIENLWQV